ncbi:MAG: host attachment protein [Verrucomicrobiota bacterium]
MKKVVVVANASRVRAFRLVPSENGGRSRIFEIETRLKPVSPAPTATTDEEGRFPAGSDASSIGMQRGEAHNRTLEEERRSIKEVTAEVKRIIQEEGGSWELAVPSTIGNRIVEDLPGAVKKQLNRIENSDYTGLPLKAIEKIFA